MFSNKNIKQTIMNELSDVFYFILRFADKYHIDLSVELYKKIKENNKKYPVEIYKGSSKKYDELLV